MNRHLSGQSHSPPWSGLARLTPVLRVPIFLAGVSLIWVPLALPFYWLAHQGVLDLGGAIATGLLYVVFLGVWPIWARRVHGLRAPWHTLGVHWRLSVFGDLITGLGLGLLGIAALILIESGLGWAELSPPSWQISKIALEGGLVALAVATAEELLFRGWLLYELEQGCSAAIAMGLNASLFAIAHFIKPLPAIVATLPQFAGLLLLGLALVWARRTPSQHRPVRPRTALGFAIGLHAGLVWGYYVINVGQITRLSGGVPAWVTGIDRNPLAGLLGITLLAALAWLFRQSSRGQIKLPPI